MSDVKFPLPDQREKRAKNLRNTRLAYNNIILRIFYDWEALSQGSKWETAEIILHSYINLNVCSLSIDLYKL